MPGQIALGRVDQARLLGYQFPPPSEADGFVRPNDGQAWVVELEPYRRQLTDTVLYRSIGPGLGGLGRSGLGRGTALTMRRPVSTMLRYASTTGGMVTDATDTPASTWIEGRLRATDNIVTREIPKRGERLGGILAQVSAEIKIEASDGALDNLLDDYVWRDRPVRLRLGQTTRVNGREVPGPLSSFETVFEGVALQAYSQGPSDLTITVQDGSKKFDSLIQGKTFAGTGGRHGGLDLTGKRLPLVYGYCLEVVPTLVDNLRLIYQIHDGEFLRLIEVRDRGVGLFPTIDVPTYEDLEALTVEGEDVEDPDIALGSYATCRAEGYFRLGGSASSLKVDVEGDGLYDGPRAFDNGRLFDTGAGFDAPGAQTHNRYAGGMLFRILTTRANIPASEFDIDRVAQFDAENPYRQGVAIGPDEKPTCREICAKIVDSIAACLVRNGRGKLILRTLDGPAQGASRDLPASAIASGGLERMQLPWGTSWHTVRVQYGRRWSPSPLSELSADLQADYQAELGREFSYADVTDAELKALLPDRDPLLIDSFLVDQAAAYEIAARYLRFYAAALMLRVTARGIGFRADPLETVEVTHPRYGLSDGRNMLVISSSVRAARNETVLVLLG